MRDGRVYDVTMMNPDGDTVTWRWEQPHAARLQPPLPSEVQVTQFEHRANGERRTFNVTSLAGAVFDLYMVWVMDQAIDMRGAGWYFVLGMPMDIDMTH